MTEESKAADPPTAQTVRDWKAKAENCFMTSSLDEYCPSEFIELADAYLALLAGPQTVEDVKTAVVPVEWLERVRSAATTLSGERHPMTDGQRGALSEIAETAAAYAAAPAPLPVRVEDVARVIREKVCLSVDTGGLSFDIAGHEDAAQAILALFGSRPSSPVVPTEQAEGAVVGWPRPMSDEAKVAGQPVLVYFKQHGWLTVEWGHPASRLYDGEVTPTNGIWTLDDFKFGPYSVRGYCDGDDTHWMPLPAAPDSTPAAVSPGTEPAGRSVVGDLVEGLTTAIWDWSRANTLHLGDIDKCRALATALATQGTGGVDPIFREAMGRQSASLGTAVMAEALRNLKEACEQADAEEELPEHVDGSLLDAANRALDLYAEVSHQPAISTDRGEIG